VSFATKTICVASQRVFIVAISLSTQSGNFWIYPRIVICEDEKLEVLVSQTRLFINKKGLRYSLLML
jgi:hypothetical protein